MILEEPQAQWVSGTVRGEIEFALENLGYSRDPIEARVLDLLGRFDLVPLAQRDPRTLSAGEQERSLLAAVLAPAPELLLLDDPFLHLGPGGVGRIWRDLRRMVKSGELGGILLAGHDAELAVTADKVGILYGGELLRWGGAEAVLRGGLPPPVAPPLAVWLEGRLGEAGWRLSGEGLDLSSLAGRLAGDLKP
jgi:energy-coupling factor transporter ATP-binding protein EcfA2